MGFAVVEEFGQGRQGQRLVVVLDILQHQREIRTHLIIIVLAPDSMHDLFIGDDSTVFCIMLRKSTFNTSFFKKKVQLPDATKSISK